MRFYACALSRFTSRADDNQWSLRIATEAEVVAAADHAAKLKSVKKEKPKKPPKGPDSSLLCFNLEMRKVVLQEPEFKGARHAI